MKRTITQSSYFHIMKLIFLFFITFTLVTSNKIPSDLSKVTQKSQKEIKKLSFVDQVEWHINQGSNKLPVPKDDREASYLQMILQREHSEKQLKLTKDISQINIYTTISLVLFSVIFAVSCLLYGLVHLGAGANHFRETINIEASKVGAKKENLFHTDPKLVGR